MPARTFPPDILELGDRIAALTADKAARLNRYLAQVHGIEAVCSTVVLPTPEPDVIVQDGIAQAAVWAVVLEGVDATKRIALMKFVREKLSLSLLQARNLVESAPQVVREHLTQTDAEALQAELIAAGARATVRSATA
jgi:large subunit ribosomal protein L7/L12